MTNFSDKIFVTFIVIFSLVLICQAADDYTFNPFSGKLDNRGDRNLVNSYSTSIRQKNDAFKVFTSTDRITGSSFGGYTRGHNAAYGGYTSRTAYQIILLATKAKLTLESTARTAHTSSVTPYGGHPSAGSDKQVQVNVKGVTAGASMLNYSGGKTLVRSSNADTALEVIGTALERAILFAVRDCQGVINFQIDSTGCSTYFSNPRFRDGFTRSPFINQTSVSKSVSIAVNFKAAVLTMRTTHFRFYQYSSLTTAAGFTHYTPRKTVARSIFFGGTSARVTPSATLTGSKWYTAYLENVSNICQDVMGNFDYVFKTAP